MNPTTAPSLKKIALGDLAHELAVTRRFLERVPEAHFAWKPHEKSMSLGGLATHLAQLPFWQLNILKHDEFDLMTAPPPLSAAADREEVLRRFDENSAALQSALNELDEAALGSTWTLRRGEQVIFQMPRVAALRSMGISHMVHHRGQLSVYLRLLEVPVPGAYGPSADDARL
jgi:uncharacterized damage-inducible protein DinB